MPRPALSDRGNDDNDDDDFGDDDGGPRVFNEPVDWRLSALFFALPWAGFTSMVLSIVRPGPVGIAAWFLATGAIGIVVGRHRRIFRRWQRQERRRLGPPVAPSEPPSASSQGFEDTDSAHHILWVEPALDKDAAGLDGASPGPGQGVVAEVKLGLADGAAGQGQIRPGADDGGGDDV